MGIPIGLPAPEWITRLGARFVFRTDPELAIHGRYVKSRRLEESGFNVKYPNLTQALNHLIQGK